MANPTMTLISSQTLGGTTASVTFSSIPSTYNDLKLVISARGDTGAGSLILRFSFNGDSATNYSATSVTGTAGVSSSSRSTSVTVDNFAIMDGGGSTTNTFSATEAYFPNYNSTGGKPWFSSEGVEGNATTYPEIQAIAHLYRGGSGISSITLTPSSGNFVQFSDFYLYGIKNS